VGFVTSSRQIGQAPLSSGSATSFLPCLSGSSRYSSSLSPRPLNGGGTTEGGGSSIEAEVFAANWRAKSDACHHSKNLRKNIDVGRRILSESKSRGRAIRVKVVAVGSDEDARGACTGRRGEREAISNARCLIIGLGSVSKTVSAWDKGESGGCHYVICLRQSPHPGLHHPMEGCMVFRLVEQVGQIEC
jgi:hypothetical protein